MSHFTVLVIGDNVEEQLAPYSEELQVDPHQEDCWCKGSLAREAASDIASKTFNRQTQFAEWRKIFDEVLDEADQKPDPACLDCHGSGLRTTTYNPNSKWDWYTIGGRWLGFFKLKEHAKGFLGKPGAFINEKSLDADQARKGDIDFEAMQKFYSSKAEKTWKESQKESVEGRFFIYGIKPNELQEQYIARSSNFSTFAVVKNGKWFEKGQMGWWGATSNEKEEDQWQEEFNKLVDSLSDDILLTIVDCHI